jgi:cysteinyl-tRNA synthetase
MELSSILGPKPRKNRPNKPILLSNTLSGEKEEFVSIVPGKVRMYNCGPTVYDYPHIGNFRSYVFADTLRRVFEYNGYSVKQVLNITDVGHLTSDADEGDDKVEKKAKDEGKKVADIVESATKAFFDDLKKLNAKNIYTTFPKASEHIPEQIAFVKTLVEKGYGYKTSDGIYFDTSKFKNYGKLGKIDTEGLKEGARVETNKEKHNITDFAIWKFSKEGEERQQEWDSPWGVGFPGWHLECSAMAMKHLGKKIDVHTGGIDHIPTHHNNEIAQTETVTADTFSNYWMHNAFIKIEGKKISKSLGNTIFLRNIADRGIPPLAYRYWLLTAHYNRPINFTWDALEGANAGFFKLQQFFVEKLGSKNGKVIKEYREKFHEYINDDLDTPKALALLHELMKDAGQKKEDVRATFLEFDEVLGLGFKEATSKLLENLKGKKKLDVADIPREVTILLNDREKARKSHDYALADEIRLKIEQSGYSVKDTHKGAKLERI